MVARTFAVILAAYSGWTAAAESVSSCLSIGARLPPSADLVRLRMKQIKNIYPNPRKRFA